MSAIRKAKEEHLRAIGDRLTYAIKASRFSRAALARKSGVRVDAIGRLEKARRLPALGALKRLADVLGVPSGWLVFGEPPTPSIPLAAPEDRDRRRRDNVVGTDGELDPDPGPA